MKNVGRKSKILKFGLVDKIEYLRTRGLSYERIAQEVNSNLPPSQHISKDAISRYFNSVTQQVARERPLEIIDTHQQMIREIMFNIDKLTSISNTERIALKEYIRGCQRAFETKINRAFRGHSRIGETDYNKICRLLIQASNELCSKCMKKVSHSAEKELQRRGK